MTPHFLDANIFLELNVNDEDYGEFCDTITDHSCDKTTNKRVLREVDDIKAVFLRTFNTLIKFFKKNIKKKRFISDSFIGEKDFNRIRDIENWVEKYYGAAKIHRLEWLKKYFELTVNKRLHSLNVKIISSSSDVGLFTEINSVMVDEDDAWHITDAYTWCITKGKILVWSIDDDIINPREQILSKICTYQGISRAKCLLDISHIKYVQQNRL